MLSDMVVIFYQGFGRYVCGIIKIFWYRVLSFGAFLCYTKSVMKKELLDILVCPVCKGKLVLTIKEENKDEIVTGSLYCKKCNVTYQIEETIPNLLPQEKPAPKVGK
jgi:uncharacterized protein YbaR (Trm112 family)